MVSGCAEADKWAADGLGRTNCWRNAGRGHMVSRAVLELVRSWISCEHSDNSALKRLDSNVRDKYRIQNSWLKTYISEKSLPWIRQRIE